MTGSAQQTDAQRADKGPDSGLWASFRGRRLVARLRKNPDDARLVLALREHYRKTGDENSLVDFLERRAGRVADEKRACEAYVEAAETVLAASSDHVRARSLYEKALQRWPGHREALQRLQTLLEQDGDHRRLLQWLEHVARHFADSESAPEHLPGVHCKLAEILESRLGRPDLAVEHLWLALQRNPTLMAAIHAGRRICLELGDLEGVNAFYELQIQATISPEDRFRLWMDLSLFRSEQLCDLSGAILALRRALSVCPNNVEAMFNLARSLYVRGQQADGEASQEDCRRAAEVLCLMAQQAPPKEAREYLSQALQCAPDHERARMMLGQLSAGASAMVAEMNEDNGELPSSARHSLRPNAELQPFSSAGQPEKREADSRPGDDRDAGSTDRLYPLMSPPRPSTPEVSEREPGVLEPGPRGRMEPSAPRSPASVTARAVTAASQKSPLPYSVARLKRALAVRKSEAPPSAAGATEASASGKPTSVASAPNAREISVPARPQRGSVGQDSDLPRSVWRVKRALAARRSAPPPATDANGHAAKPEDRRPPAQKQRADQVVSCCELAPSDDRIELEVNLGATTEANLYVGFSGDPSEGGVFVPTHSLLPNGTLLRMLITLPGGCETHAYGRVRFVCNPAEESSEATVGMGVQFEAITAEGAGLLRSFTSNRSPIFLDE